MKKRERTAALRAAMREDVYRALGGMIGLLAEHVPETVQAIQRLDDALPPGVHPDHVIEVALVVEQRRYFWRISQ